jgi:serine/threonine-protein kinase HipA
MGFAYNPKGGWTAQHQMSVNGKFDDITRDDLLEFAKRNNIKDAAEIIDSIVEVSSRWPIKARECEVPKPMIDAIVPNLKLTDIRNYSQY